MISELNREDVFQIFFSPKRKRNISPSVSKKSNVENGGETLVEKHKINCSEQSESNQTVLIERAKSDDIYGIPALLFGSSQHSFISNGEKQRFSSEMEMFKNAPSISSPVVSGSWKQNRSDYKLDSRFGSLRKGNIFNGEDSLSNCSPYSSEDDDVDADVDDRIDALNRQTIIGRSSMFKNHRNYADTTNIKSKKCRKAESAVDSECVSDASFPVDNSAERDAGIESDFSSVAGKMSGLSVGKPATRRSMRSSINHILSLGGGGSTKKNKKILSPSTNHSPNVSTSSSTRTSSLDSSISGGNNSLVLDLTAAHHESLSRISYNSSVITPNYALMSDFCAADMTTSMNSSSIYGKVGGVAMTEDPTVARDDDNDVDNLHKTAEEDDYEVGGRKAFCASASAAAVTTAACARSDRTTVTPFRYHSITIHSNNINNSTRTLPKRLFAKDMDDDEEDESEFSHHNRMLSVRLSPATSVPFPANGTAQGMTSKTRNDFHSTSSRYQTLLTPTPFIESQQRCVVAPSPNQLSDHMLTKQQQQHSNDNMLSLTANRTASLRSKSIDDSNDNSSACLVYGQTISHSCSNPEMIFAASSLSSLQHGNNVSCSVPRLLRSPSLPSNLMIFSEEDVFMKSGRSHYQQQQQPHHWIQQPLNYTPAHNGHHDDNRNETGNCSNNSSQHSLFRDVSSIAVSPTPMQQQQQQQQYKSQAMGKAFDYAMTPIRSSNRQQQQQLYDSEDHEIAMGDLGTPVTEVGSPAVMDDIDGLEDEEEEEGDAEVAMYNHSFSSERQSNNSSCNNIICSNSSSNNLDNSLNGSNITLLKPRAMSISGNSSSGGVIRRSIGDFSICDRSMNSESSYGRDTSSSYSVPPNNGNYYENSSKGSPMRRQYLDADVDVDHEEYHLFAQRFMHSPDNININLSDTQHQQMRSCFSPGPNNCNSSNNNSNSAPCSPRNSAKMRQTQSSNRSSGNLFADSIYTPAPPAIMLSTPSILPNNNRNFHAMPTNSYSACATNRFSDSSDHTTTSNHSTLTTSSFGSSSDSCVGGRGYSNNGGVATSSSIKGGSNSAPLSYRPLPDQSAFENSTLFASSNLSYSMNVSQSNISSIDNSINQQFNSSSSILHGLSSSLPTSSASSFYIMDQRQRINSNRDSRTNAPFSMAFSPPGRRRGSEGGDGSIQQFAYSRSTPTTAIKKRQVDAFPSMAPSLTDNKNTTSVPASSSQFVCPPTPQQQHQRPQLPRWDGVAAVTSNNSPQSSCFSSNNTSMHSISSDIIDDGTQPQQFRHPGFHIAFSASSSFRLNTCKGNNNHPPAHQQVHSKYNSKEGVGILNMNKHSMDEFDYGIPGPIIHTTGHISSSSHSSSGNNLLSRPIPVMRQNSLMDSKLLLTQTGGEEEDDDDVIGSCDERDIQRYNDISGTKTQSKTSLYRSNNSRADNGDSRSSSRNEHRSSSRNNGRKKKQRVVITFHEDFEDEGLLGSGTFADVFKVKQRRKVCEGDDCSSSFAVKKSKRQFRSKRDRDWLMAEVHTMKLLGQRPCPYVIPFIRAWQEESYFYVQMGYAERGTVKDLLTHLASNATKRHRSNNVSDGIATSCVNYAAECSPYLVADSTIWHIIHNVAAGLRHIHECGIVHLDIKPANLLITAVGSIQIGDFGMAAKIGSSEDGHEGDTRYMADELLNNSERLPSADIFSLGLTLYELCCVVSYESMGAIIGSNGSGENSSLFVTTVSKGLPTNGTMWHVLREGSAPRIPASYRSTALSDLVHATMKALPADRPTAEQILIEPSVHAITVAAASYASNNHCDDGGESSSSSTAAAVVVGDEILQTAPTQLIANNIPYFSRSMSMHALNNNHSSNNNNNHAMSTSTPNIGGNNINYYGASSSVLSVDTAGVIDYAALGERAFTPHCDHIK